MNQEITLALQHASSESHFSLLFPPTRHGARAARRAAEAQLVAWGHPPAVDPAATAVLLVAELTANAALHGRVRGRETRLGLALTADTVRIEVTDARGDRLPAAATEPGDGESGRGLLLVQALADDWGVKPHHPGGKTVWAILALPAPPAAR